MERKRIKKALVSVYQKDKLDVIIKKLHSEGVEFISTGGTQTFIESLDIPCSAVEDLTGYPSILGGRVKTLHPKVFGGILSRRDLEKDNEQIAEYEIPEIDLVIVDLYPFEATVAAGADEPTTIEKIDIGGISLIRAAAKNFKDVVIVASQDQYQPLLEVLEANGAQTTIEERRWFARIRILSVTAITFDDLSEEHAKQENMTLDELKTVIREIYPNETALFVLHYALLSE